MPNAADFLQMNDGAAMSAGCDSDAAALQMGLMRMSGQPPSAPFAAARDLARAVARAELGGDDECDPMSMKF